MEPETAHNLTIQCLKVLQSSPLQHWYERNWVLRDPRLQTNLLGLSFPNPVGLAAGFDKNASVYPALASLGFGFIEVGTLTPRPQPGNPKPRLFRLPEDHAIINRMGFNNHGAEQAKASFQKHPKPQVPIGVNLGKNKDTHNDHAADDYIKSLELLYPFGDYFVINISSPNTIGLRDLQHIDALQHLLSNIIAKRNELVNTHGIKRPILLKIAPDISFDEARAIAHAAHLHQIDGLIATNTTLSREGIHSLNKKENGGLSGAPLKERSTELIRHLYSILKGAIPIIGVGGVFTGQDAYEKICAGASLVQVYTGMIYRGPAIAKKINQELLQILEQNQMGSIQELVGIDASIKKLK
jgi:dihydroorotate dehydrogenase